MPFMKPMAAVLLVLTLCLGVLLALVVGQRNVARTQLKSTVETLQDKKQELQDTDSQLNEFKFKFNRCEASLNQQNINLSNQQQEAIAAEGTALERADKVLANLPSKIAQDRQATTVASANEWMGDLFK